jgi:hypothetical protein
MLIKQADDKTQDLQALKSLATRPDASAETKKKIEQEIRNIQSGMRGEAEAAYEMEFHYGASKNWMILHDLRLECDGRIAQIDHLLVNRMLEIYVCESKRFSEGVAINEQGEFSAFFGGKPYGVPSPLEQNRRHMAVLESVFKTRQIVPPRRLGFSITPALSGLVLVSKTARISRPKTKIEGVELVIKNDQLKARIDKNLDKDNNPLTLARLIGQDTLEDFSRRLANAHVPLTFNWPAKFGLSATHPTVKVGPVTKELPAQPAVAVPAQKESVVEAASNDGHAKKSKLACATCEAIVPYNVAKFCWFNKPRFGGKVYCLECQKNVPSPA